MARNNTTLIVVAAAIAVGIIIIANSANADDSTDNGSGAGANMVSQNQLSVTEGLEGFSATAYKDGSSGGKQLYSIGYGHQIQPGEQYLLTTSISQAQGQQFLLNDMQTVVDTLNNSGIGFTQGQFDAAADFGYNAGVGALQQLINVYTTQGADAVTAWLPTAYIYWHPVPGGAAVINQTNVNRRNQEAQIWQS